MDTIKTDKLTDIGLGIWKSTLGVQNWHKRMDTYTQRKVISGHSPEDMRRLFVRPLLLGRRCVVDAVIAHDGVVVIVVVEGEVGIGERGGGCGGGGRAPRSALVSLIPWQDRGRRQRGSSGAVGHRGRPLTVGGHQEIGGLDARGREGG